MRISEPFGFWSIQPDGERAYRAYEHIHSYCEGALVQYARLYELWRRSSDIPEQGDLAAVAQLKRTQMRQVVRDIHCLLVFLQVVWKTLQVMSDPGLYPNFTPVAALRDKWHDYFEQYRAARNTFEHYEDQVLGADSRGNSPGYGLSLSEVKGFRLGTQHRVSIDQNAHDQLKLFVEEFDAAVRGIVCPIAPVDAGSAQAGDAA